MKFVWLFVKNVLNTRINQHLKAMNARRVRNINRSLFDGRAVFGSLSNGIHFCMNRAKTVLFDFAVGCYGFIDEATDISAVRHAGRRTVITRG